MLARACAAQTSATFLKLAGPQLVQMFIGDGAKLVRDAFALAKEKSPCIIFIDEIDAIGTKRFDSEVSGDREVQRTMLELLNQLDGFSSDANIKVRNLTPAVLSRVFAPPHHPPRGWLMLMSQCLHCRSLQRPTGQISSTPPSCGLAGLTGRSSFHTRLRMHGLRSCRSIPGR